VNKKPYLDLRKHGLNIVKTKKETLAYLKKIGYPALAKLLK